MLPRFEDAKALFAAHNISLSESLYEKLDCYAASLIAYNENVNLTAITAPQEIFTKHFLDSLLLLRHCEIPTGASILDVGSGAGFPSVPIFLARPDLKLTLLDSLNKRIVFLELLCQKLDITASFLHSRAEDAAKLSAYREQFDVVTARAVAAMPTLTELCLPFVKVDGTFAAMKGPSEDANAAKNAVSLLGGAMQPPVDYTCDGEGRRLFLVKKISQTPTKYPRNSGQIKNKPL